MYKNCTAASVKYQLNNANICTSKKLILAWGLVGLRAHTASRSGPQDPVPKDIHASNCHQYHQELGTAKELRPCALFTHYSLPSEDLKTPNYFAPHGEESRCSHLCVVPWHAVPGGWIWGLLVSYLLTKNVCKIISNNKTYTYKRLNLTWIHWKFKMDMKNGYNFQCKARNPVSISPDIRLKFCLLSSSRSIIKANGCKPFRLSGGAGLGDLPLPRLWPRAWARAAKSALCCLCISTSHLHSTSVLP